MCLGLALGVILLWAAPTLAPERCFAATLDPERDMIPPAAPHTPAPPGRVLFSEDFSDTSLARWHSDRDRVWSVRGRMLRADLPDGKQQRAFLYAGSEEWSDYAVDLDVFAVRGVDKGVVVRVKDEAGVGIDLRGSGYEDVLLYRSQLRLGRARVVNANGQWHHVRIEAVGNRYRVFVDGTLVLDRHDLGNGRPRGKIALPAYTGGSGECTLFYDNIVVTAL